MMESYYDDLCNKIDDLQERIRNLGKENAALRRELDAAVADIEKDSRYQCELCAFKTGITCAGCSHTNGFKWRGVQDTGEGVQASNEQDV